MKAIMKLEDLRTIDQLSRVATVATEQQLLPTTAANRSTFFRFFMVVNGFHATERLVVIDSSSF